MYCRNCGNEIFENFETCPYCKAPVSQNYNFNAHNEAGTPYKSNNKSSSGAGVRFFLIMLIIGIVASFLINFLSKDTANIKSPEQAQKDYEETVRRLQEAEEKQRNILNDYIKSKKEYEKALYNYQHAK